MVVEGEETDAVGGMGRWVGEQGVVVVVGGVVVGGVGVEVAVGEN